jgi:hypothetical protein
MRQAAILGGMLATVALAGVAPADPSLLGEHRAAAGRFGAAQILPSAAGERLVVNGATMMENRFVAIRGLFAPAGADHEWLVAEEMHGGNMCPAAITLYRLSAAGVARTVPLGDCLGAIVALAFPDGAIEIGFAHPDVTVERVTYRFDGRQVTETTTTAALAAPGTGAVPAADAARLAALHPGAALEDAALQGRLLAHVGPAELADLGRRMIVGSAVERRGDWLVGAGCKPHECNARGGLWVLRPADGMVAAVWIDDRRVAMVRGAASALSDPAVAAYLAERLR